MVDVSLFPFRDVARIAAWLAGFAVVNFLPGYVLVGRHLDRMDRATRVYCSIAAGMCFVTLAGLLLTVVRVPFDPASTAVVLLVAGVASHRSRGWRSSLAGLSGSVPPACRMHVALVATSVLVLAAVIALAFRNDPASPHLHDASNHAFLVKRIAEAKSMAMGRLFADPYGLPRNDYLVGWHAGAALVSSLTGIRPFVSAWYYAAACAAMLPLALMLAWRVLGARPLVAAVACVVAVSNYYTPTNLFSWGGYGQIVGLFVAPWVVLVSREALRGRRAAIAVLCGLSLVALLHVHGSEVYLVAVLTLIALLPGRLPADRRRGLAAAGLVVAILASLGGLPLILAGYQFSVAEAVPPSPTSRSFSGTWTLVQNFVAGNTPRMQQLLIPVLVFGLLARGTRRFALATVAVLALYFAVEHLADPVSLALTRPMYHHTARLANWFAFFTPVLYASAIVFLADLLRSLLNLYPLPRPAVGTVVWAVGALLVWTHLWPGVYWSYRPLSARQPFIVFTEDDARLARRMAEELPASTVIANQDDDGSYWFMHASGLRFLDPTSWETGSREGRSWRGLIDQLGASPWPDGISAIRECGVEYYLVSDTLLRGVQPQVSREGLRGDPRFEAVMEGEDTALFRILWDREPALR